MDRFSDKVVLVTGASSGIGRATALRLAGEGAAVVLASRREDEGEATARDIRTAGGTALFIRTDVTVEKDVAALVAAAVREFGRIDAAFNNAGAINAFGPIQATSTSAWDREIAVNLTSVFLCLKHEVPVLVDAGGGSILNNASNAGAVGMAGVGPYVAAKHGVVGLTRAVALETAARGVRVNALVAGAVDTPAFRSAGGGTPEGAAAIARLHPVNRIATAQEVASFAAYLLSEETTFVTGAALAIDGGWTAQ